MRITVRNQRILDLHDRGCTNRNIAQFVGVSDATISDVIGKRNAMEYLEGVPQIPSDVHALLAMGGEHLMTEEQEERSNAHIAAACREIRRQLGNRPRNVNGEGSHLAKPMSRIVFEGQRGGTYSL